MPWRKRKRKDTREDVQMFKSSGTLAKCQSMQRECAVWGPEPEPPRRTRKAGARVLGTQGSACSSADVAQRQTAEGQARAAAGPVKPHLNLSKSSWNWAGGLVALRI